MNKWILTCSTLMVLLMCGCKKTPVIEPEVQNKFIVYPNPCQRICNFSLINVSGVGYTFVIINTDGKELIKIENPQSDIVLDFSKETNGKYVAILTNGSNSYSQTFYKYN